MNLLIIGNGIAGITTAREVRKMDSSVHITVISSETSHFFSRTALMYIYMGHMTYAHTKPYADTFWKKNRINLHYGRVESVQVDKKQVCLQDNSTLRYDKLVLALGSQSSFLTGQGLRYLVSKDYIAIPICKKWKKIHAIYNKP